MAGVLFVIYIPEESNEPPTLDKTSVSPAESQKNDSEVNTDQSAEAASPGSVEDTARGEVPKSNSSASLPSKDAATAGPDQYQTSGKVAARTNDENVNSEPGADDSGDVTNSGESGSERANPSDTPNDVPVAADDPVDSKDTCTTDSIPGSEVSESDDPSEDVTVEEVCLVESQSLAQALHLVLKTSGITKDIWTKKKDGIAIQVMFTLETHECDKMLFKLTSLGIGTLPNTTISLFPATIHYRGEADPVLTPTSEALGEVSAPQSEKDGPVDKKKNEFIKSIKSKLTVAQVVEGVKANARLTFDYVMFIVLASLLAGLGLAENSSVILVASMLVSPLMGPILGWTFGTVVQNRKLWQLGIKTELIGLSVCTLCGFLFGLLTSCFSYSGAYWGATDSWPTDEMRSRGLGRSLWVGILIAVPSGAGVALSVLGGNSGSLVGVAISASLLPPAVNAGMLWAYAMVTAIHPPATINSAYDISNNTTAADPVIPVPPNCPQLVDNAYEFVHNCYMPTEAFILGCISLLLTILNILCIFFMGIVVLKIKEVAPHTADTENLEQFWKRDIKVARDSYKTARGPDSLDLAAMARKIVKEFKTIQEDGEEDIASGPKTPTTPQQDLVIAWDELLGEYFEEVEQDPVAGKVPNAENKISKFLRQISQEGNAVMDEMVPHNGMDHLSPTNPAMFHNIQHSAERRWHRAEMLRKRRTHFFEGVGSPPLSPNINPFPFTPAASHVQDFQRMYIPNHFSSSHKETPVREQNNTFLIRNPKHRRKDKKESKRGGATGKNEDPFAGTDAENKIDKPRFLVTPVEEEGENKVTKEKERSVVKFTIPDEKQPLVESKDEK